MQKGSSYGVLRLVKVSGIRISLTGMILCGLLISGCSTTAKEKKKAQAHYKLGIAYLNDDLNQLAFIEFQKGLDKNPRDRDVQYGIGHIYFVQGKFKDAEKAFKKAIRIDSSFSEAHNYLGTIYERLAEPQKAISAYKKALKNPQYVTPHFSHQNLGLIYLIMEKYEDAIGEFKAALQVAPDYALAYNGLGRTYYLSEQYPESARAFESALKIVPDYAEAHFHLARTYSKQGSLKKAQKEFKQVIELAPESEFAKQSRDNLKQFP